MFPYYIASQGLFPGGTQGRGEGGGMKITRREERGTSLGAWGISRGWLWRLVTAVGFEGTSGVRGKGGRARKTTRPPCFSPIESIKVWKNSRARVKIYIFLEVYPLSMYVVSLGFSFIHCFSSGIFMWYWRIYADDRQLSIDLVFFSLPSKEYDAIVYIVA